MLLYKILSFLFSFFFFTYFTAQSGLLEVKTRQIYLSIRSVKSNFNVLYKIVVASLISVFQC